MYIGSLSQGKINLKNPTSLFIENYINRGGLHISKEVLCFSVGQRTAKLQIVKVGDLKKILRSVRVEPNTGGLGSSPG